MALDRRRGRMESKSPDWVGQVRESRASPGSSSSPSSSCYNAPSHSPRRPYLKATQGHSLLIPDVLLFYPLPSTTLTYSHFYGNQHAFARLVILLHFAFVRPTNLVLHPVVRPTHTSALTRSPARGLLAVPFPPPPDRMCPHQIQSLASLVSPLSRPPCVRTRQPREAAVS